MIQPKIPVPIQTADPELLPTYSTALSSGADVRASLAEPVVILPGSSAIIPTGIRADLPEGYEIQVRPRSGFAAKNQVTVLNARARSILTFAANLCDFDQPWKRTVCHHSENEDRATRPRSCSSCRILFERVFVNDRARGRVSLAILARINPFRLDLFRPLRKKEHMRIFQSLDSRLVSFLDADTRDEAIDALIGPARSSWEIA